MIHIKNYNWCELDELTEIVKKKGVRYRNYPFSFDIETTSFMQKVLKTCLVQRPHSTAYVNHFGMQKMNTQVVLLS